MREIHKDTEALRKKRSELLDDIRARANRLGELADTAATEMPPGDAAAKPEPPTPKREAVDEAGSPVATTGSSQTPPPSELH